MYTGFRRLLIGRPLPTSEEVHQRLSKLKALAVFSSDALSSVAYATEEILLVLVAAGALAGSLAFPIALAIVLLLSIVAISYHQTIHGYPSGGGAYIVAYDNLGTLPGLVAAAALLIDYVLTVAVSITAGIAAILSAFPQLAHLRVGLCLLAIALITWANLRGVRESGTLFAIPTYAFVFLVMAMVLVGLIRVLTGTPATGAAVAEARNTALHGLSLFLVLRAFASGCTALTGIEAISNGIPAFKPPESSNAGKTLIVMAVLLSVMFLGITFLAQGLAVRPSEHETVVSQLARQILPGRLPYLLLQGATTMILILAANTSFADFPRLTSILARDRFLPRQLANLGDRLVFSNGILILASLAAGLVVIFRGRTHGLIPLYAVGVFLAFTLSQTGMVRHWWRIRGAGWRWKATVNGVGAAATGIVLLVVAGTKFTHGAWVVLALLAALIWIFHTIKGHYLSIAQQLSLEGRQPQPWPYNVTEKRHKVIVPISGMHRGTLAALSFARSVSADVTAVMVDIEEQVTGRVQEKWERWGQDIPLVILHSPYRSLLQPLLSYLQQVDGRDPERGPAVVVLPEFVPAHGWQHLLHNQTALLIKAALLYSRADAGKDRVIIDIPYHLKE